MGILPQYGLPFYHFCVHLSMNNFHNSGALCLVFLCHCSYIHVQPGACPTPPAFYKVIFLTKGSVAKQKFAADPLLLLGKDKLEFERLKASKGDADCYTSDIGHWFAMTGVFVTFLTKPDAESSFRLSLRASAHTGVAIRFSYSNSNLSHCIRIPAPAALPPAFPCGMPRCF